MQFVTGPKLKQTVARIAGSSVRSMAVAFWGAGSEGVVEKGSGSARIVCNLRLGGTNPRVIRWLLDKGHEVRHSDTLHAKVYISDDEALVTSANFSINGLRLQGDHQSGFEEAGVVVSEELTLAAIQAWFQSTYEGSRNVTEADLLMADIAWGRRGRHASPVQDFANFDVEAHKLLINWWPDENDPEVNTSMLPDGAESGKEFAELLRRGLQIDGEEDRSALTDCFGGLAFRLTQRNRPSRTVGFQWFETGHRIIEKAVRNPPAPEWIPVMLQPQGGAKPPFPINTPRFKNAFYEVMARKDFKPLLSSDEPGSWFTDKRVALMQDFWRDLHKFYLQQPIEPSKVRPKSRNSSLLPPNGHPGR